MNHCHQLCICCIMLVSCGVAQLYFVRHLSDVWKLMCRFLAEMIAIKTKVQLGGYVVKVILPSHNSTFLPLLDQYVFHNWQPHVLYASVHKVGISQDAGSLNGWVDSYLFFSSQDMLKGKLEGRYIVQVDEMVDIAHPAQVRCVSFLQLQRSR